MRIFSEQRFELRRGKRIDHDIGRRSGRVQRRPRACESIDSQHVARAANVAQFDAVGRLIPQRYRPLLDDEDVRLVWFTLPENVFVGFVKSHAALRCEGEQILLLHGMKGRMFLEKISNPIADGGSVHESKEQEDDNTTSARSVLPVNTPSTVWHDRRAIAPERASRCAGARIIL